jgi:hypothetical protein
MSHKPVMLSLSLILCLVAALAPDASQGVWAAPQGELHVCSSGCAFSSIQAAVDAAVDGDVIKVSAGTYSGVSLKNALKQVVYINKSITLKGGYTSTDWSTYNPLTNQTILDAEGQGRVLYITLRDKTVTISGLRLVNGDATQSGDIGSSFSGGGVNIYGWKTTSSITLTDNQIFSNNTNGQGAGLNIWGIALTMTGNTISNNQIKNANGKFANGGGASLDSTTGQITNNTFSNNTVPIGDYYGDAGGGLYACYSTLTLTGNTFQGNEANNGGGLSEMRVSMTLTGNTFKSNSAANGGGVYFGSDNVATITISMTANTFIQNTATGSGGGAYLSPYQISADHNTFDSNTATITSDSGCQGAGLLIAGTNKVVVDHNIITRNVAHSEGGGVCVVGQPLVQNNLITANQASEGGGVAATGQGLNPGYNPLLINNVINGNQVTGDGSAVSINGSSLTLIHNTISQNTGGDASILMVANLFSHYGALTMTNTIIDHQATGIHATHGYTAAVNGVLWSTVATPIKSDDAGSITVTNQITGNAKFDPDGYHLLTGSAAINHGIVSTVLSDIDGQVRPNGSMPDLGADEWYPPLSHIYLPYIRK